VAEPADMIVPLLREMRAESATLHQKTRTLIEALDLRLGRVEDAQTSYRHALTADTLMSKLLTGSSKIASSHSRRRSRTWRR